MKGFRANKEGLCAYVHKGAVMWQNRTSKVRAKMEGCRANKEESEQN